MTKGKTLVAFGDSLTATRGEVKIYCMHLEEAFPEYKIINSGIRGNTTEMARERFEDDVLKHSPDIAIIMFGINDSMVDVWKDPPESESRVSKDQYENNLRYFVSELKKINCTIIMMTPSPMCWTERLIQNYGKPPYNPDAEDGLNVTLDKYIPVMKKVAKEEGVTLIDINSEYRKYIEETGIKLDDMHLDGMHPNNIGHKMVAEILIKEIGTGKLQEK